MPPSKWIDKDDGGAWLFSEFEWPWFALHIHKSHTKTWPWFVKGFIFDAPTDLKAKNLADAKVEVLALIRIRLKMMEEALP